MATLPGPSLRQICLKVETESVRKSVLSTELVRRNLFVMPSTGDAFLWKPKSRFGWKYCSVLCCSIARFDACGDAALRVSTVIVKIFCFHKQLWPLKIKSTSFNFNLNQKSVWSWSGWACRISRTFASGGQGVTKIGVVEEIREKIEEDLNKAEDRKTLLIALLAFVDGKPPPLDNETA